MIKINTLFCENNELSIGRTCLWLLMIPAIYIWLTCKDIGIYHFYTIGIFLAYNFSKKIPQFISLIKAWKGTDTAQEVPIDKKEIG